MRFLLALILTAGAASAQVAPAANDTCGAGGFEGLIGQTAEILELLEFDRPARSYAEGDPVTLDYLPERINFVVDTDPDAPRIVEVSCG